MMNSDWLDHARRVGDCGEQFDISMDIWVSMLHRDLSINS